ncbi:MAG: hypothetical protein GY845_36800 [Planctomycetes bacterium]|nr:hypothetical protein [Planctomycetota bacterium]
MRFSREVFGIVGFFWCAVKRFLLTAPIKVAEVVPRGSAGGAGLRGVSGGDFEDGV